jgi:hypothetical protein
MKHDISCRIWKFVLDNNYLAFAQQERQRPEVRVLRHLQLLLPPSLQCPTAPQPITSSLFQNVYGRGKGNPCTGLEGPSGFQEVEAAGF